MDPAWSIQKRIASAGLGNMRHLLRVGFDEGWPRRGAGTSIAEN